MSGSLKHALIKKARQLGFPLAGITTPAPPESYPKFQDWVASDHHAGMAYLAAERSLTRRADPQAILPECQSILVLGAPYSPQTDPPGSVAAYAWGEDYHDTFKSRLQALVSFLESQVGHPVPNRWYTDTGPILERDLARRAGLGWIGKNSMLINPKTGSYFLLAEILLGIELPPDDPFTTDHCGNCTRCIQACPTSCILPGRTIDARRCLSYLTIEHKGAIPLELRPAMRDTVFGCDICQQVCPWNRFALQGDPAFSARQGIPPQDMAAELRLTSQEFNLKFKGSPVKRAKRRGYLRNIATALGNKQHKESVPALIKALSDEEPLVRQHTAWALGRIGGWDSKNALEQAAEMEVDQSVLAEITAALELLNAP